MMLREQRISTADEQTYAWLGTIHAAIKKELAELVKGYGPAGGPREIEEAIGNLQAGLDDISRAQRKLDGE